MLIDLVKIVANILMENINMRHYLEGGLAGMVGLILSHPFDTIKTYIQKGSRPPNYSMKTLYRGVGAPLVGVSLEKAVVFGTYHNTQNYIQSIAISGALAGLTASLIVTPVDRIKILLQINQNRLEHIPNIRYIYQGLTVTFTREMPGFAIYFTVYDFLKRTFYTNKKITTPSAFIFGALSGLTAWCFIYPQDCIKTRIQAMEHHNKTYLTLIKDIYKIGGLGYFYKGFSLALLRALPLHAGTFATMEYLQK